LAVCYRYYSCFTPRMTILRLPLSWMISIPFISYFPFFLFACLFIQLHTAALRLIVRSWLDVPNFATRPLHARVPSGGRWNCGWETSGDFAERMVSMPFRDLLHAVKLRHGTDGFTSPPKEGVLKIFFALKIQRLRPGVNPRTWVPKASTLPLDHRSCYIFPFKF